MPPKKQNVRDIGERLRTQLITLWQSSDSNFYRDFWIRNDFDPERDFRNINDFEKIPVLTKNDLLAVLPYKRTYRTQSDSYFFPFMSSGTTNKPLVMLHQNYLHYLQTPYFEFWQQYLIQRAPRSLMVFRPPFSTGTVFASYFLERGLFAKNAVMAVGDPKDLPASARYARDIETDALRINPSIATHFARELAVVGYDPKHIKVLDMIGEPNTRTSNRLLRNAFPNAQPFKCYSSTETLYVGIQSPACTALEELHPNSYHIDDQNAVVEEKDGTMLFTSLSERPTPVIRYNTSDRIHLVPDFACSCGKTGTIGIVGSRAEGVSYKIGGAVFRADEVRRVLHKLAIGHEQDFRFHIEQEQSSDGLLVSAPLLTLRTEAAADREFAHTISQKISKHLRIGKNTLLQAEHTGYIQPLRVTHDPHIRGGQVLPPKEIISQFDVM